MNEFNYFLIKIFYVKWNQLELIYIIDCTTTKLFKIYCVTSSYSHQNNLQTSKNFYNPILLDGTKICLSLTRCSNPSPAYDTRGDISQTMSCVFASLLFLSNFSLLFESLASAGLGICGSSFPSSPTSTPPPAMTYF